MDAGTLSSAGDLAAELHALLRETDPVRWRAELAARARARWARITQSIEHLRAQPAQNPDLERALADLARVVDGASVETASQSSQWTALRARLVPAYERLSAALRARSLPAPSIRPTNKSRIAFHVASAIGSLILLEIVLTRAGTIWATGLFAGICWLLEAGRHASERMNDRLMRVRFFERIIHPHEHHQVNSATWYATALFLLATTSPVYASAVGLAVLGLGDPVAGLVGRRWGRIPLGHGRTLEGSGAFFVAGSLAALGVLLLWHTAIPLAVGLAVAGAGGLGGAAAEAVSRRIDDNFTVPVAAAACAWAVAACFGIAS